jgi:hypothetical protein
VKKRDEPPPVARGPGPRWLRIGLAGLAVIYYAALIRHPPDSRWVRPAAFFTEATSLFPLSVSSVLEYRIEAWSCSGEGDWKPIDPRPYFPIHPDDKESRFQRLGYFYFNSKTESRRDREVGKALDQYIATGHAAGADDGVTGRIGGIRVVKIVRPIPAPGEPVERYHFDPFAPIPGDQRRDKYTTPEEERKQRCAS